MILWKTKAFLKIYNILGGGGTNIADGGWGAATKRVSRDRMTSLLGLSKYTSVLALKACYSWKLLSPRQTRDANEPTKKGESFIKFKIWQQKYRVKPGNPHNPTGSLNPALSWASLSFFPSLSCYDFRKTSQETRFLETRLQTSTQYRGRW